MNISDYELLALEAVYRNTPEYFYRKVCRYYSKNFNTPLHEVEELAFSKVLQHYFEDVLESYNPEMFYDVVVQIAYPELLENEEEQLQEQIATWTEEEGVDHEALKKLREKLKASGIRLPETPETSDSEDDLGPNNAQNEAETPKTPEKHPQNTQEEDEPDIEVEFDMDDPDLDDEEEGL